MQPVIKPLISLVPLSAIAVFAAVAISLWMGSYLALKRGAAYLLGTATILGAVGAGLWRGAALCNAIRAAGRYPRNEDYVPSAFATGFLVLFGVPLVVKLYCAWIGACVTDTEKMPGTAGVRAWLSPANLILAILVTVSAYFAFDCAIPSTFALFLLALLGYPIANTIAQSPAPSETQTQHEKETLGAEREKVLQMLDAGKITAEESAELLNALGATVTAAQPARVPFSPQQRTILLGTALVVIGFFLPWFSINPGNELNKMTGEMEQQINQFAQQMPGMPGHWTMPMPNGNGSFTLHTRAINISGGDVQHGLGWIILLCACAAPALPFAAAQLDAHTRRIAGLVALGAGSFLLVYLLTQNLRFLSLGFILACAGYLVQWLALLKQNSEASGIPHIAQGGI